MKTVITGFASLSLLLSAPAALCSLLENGSFEAPPIPAGSVQQATPSGWSWSGSTGFIFSSTAGSISAPDGQQFVDIGNTPAFSLQQVFAIAEAGSYLLTWTDNANAFPQESPYTVTVSGGASSRFDANEGIDATWNSRSLLLNLAPGSYTLAFTPADIPGPLPAQDRFIDNAALVAAVPAPAAFWLLGTAMAVLARRRRTAG